MGRGAVRALSSPSYSPFRFSFQEGLVTHFKEEQVSLVTSVQNWLRGIAVPIGHAMTTVVEAIPRG